MVRDDELIDYGIWRPGAPDGVGDLHRGRVTARMPAISGAFVALAGADGFLPDSAGATGLGVGDVVIVRVVRPRAGKGPSVRLVEHRTAFGTRTGLAALELAAQEPEARVAVDDAGLAARLKPVLGERLSVAQRAWDEEVEEQVAALVSPSVELAAGARIHIEPTRALTAIDVDAGAALRQRQGKTAAPSVGEPDDRANVGASSAQDVRGDPSWISPGLRGAAVALGAGTGGGAFAAVARISPGWGWPRSCGPGYIRHCMRCLLDLMQQADGMGRSRTWRRHRTAWSRCGQRQKSWPRCSAMARPRFARRSGRSP